MEYFDRLHTILIEGTEPQGSVNFAHRKNRFPQMMGPVVFETQGYELYYHVSGTINILIGDHIYSPKPGDIFLYGPNEPHSLIVRSEEYERYTIHISTNTFQCIRNDPSITAMFETEAARHHHIALPGKTARKIEERLQHMDSLVIDESPETSYLLYAHLILLLVDLSREMQDTPYFPIGMNCPLILGEIIEYIHTSFRSIHDIDDVCKKFNISRAYLFKIFSQYTVVTPSHYIRNLKLSFAKDLLREGANVTEACYEAGFSNYSHFIQLFRKATGMTPLTYRYQNRPKK